MKLRLRLMNGQLILVEDVATWEMSDAGLTVNNINHKRSWYNRAYIATAEEEE